MTDVWVKFQSKKTSFTTFKVWNLGKNLQFLQTKITICNQEPHDQIPTTVLCFEPFKKKSIYKDKYKINEVDIAYGNFPDSVSNKSWSEFTNELSYTLNDEWNLTYYSNNDEKDIKLYPGSNKIEGKAYNRKIKAHNRVSTQKTNTQQTLILWF